MSCSHPVSWEDLVTLWAGDLPPPDEARLEEHLMGCGFCSAQSGRVSALAEALRMHIPPVVSRVALEKARARGMRIVENTFAPGERRPAVFAHQTDLLIHRLAGFDLADARRVRVTLRAESTGAVLFEDPDVPFDPREGVLIACQRHYAAMPHDTVFEVHAVAASGTESSAVYSIPHVFEP